MSGASPTNLKLNFNAFQNVPYVLKRVHVASHENLMRKSIFFPVATSFLQEKRNFSLLYIFHYNPVCLP